jgi:hypothetical protein
MTAEEARYQASGYAWAREDASKARHSAHPTDPIVKTACPAGRSSGSFCFAEAFGQGYADYNGERRSDMTSVHAAYERWQETGGRSIFPDGQTTREQIARRAAREAERARKIAAIEAYELPDPPQPHASEAAINAAIRAGELAARREEDPRSDRERAANELGAEFGTDPQEWLV